MGRRVPTVATLAVVFLGTAAATHAHHDPEGNPFRLTVTHQGLYLRATAGSATITRHEEGNRYSTRIGDAAYPLPLRGKLPVRPGARLLVLTNARWKKLSARLIHLPRGTLRRPATGNDMRYLGSVRVRRVARKPRRWRVRLPKRLRRADVLDLSVRGRASGAYQSDDVNFWAGIRAPRRR